MVKKKKKANGEEMLKPSVTFKYQKKKETC